MLGEHDLVTVLMLSSNNGLDQLAEASLLTDALCGILLDLQSLWESVNRLKGNDSTHTRHKVVMEGHQRQLPQSGI